MKKNLYILVFLCMMAFLPSYSMAQEEKPAETGTQPAAVNSEETTPEETDTTSETIQEIIDRIRKPSIPSPTAGDKWQAVLSQTALHANWTRSAENLPAADADMLDEAIEAARAYYLGAQLPLGNFRYGLEISTDQVSESDNQVRQAGALWGLSNLNRERFTEPTRRAVILGLDFFIRGMNQPPNGLPKVITYKGARTIKTGTIALFCLATIDFLEGQERYLSDEQCRPYREALESNLAFLRAMELPDGSWREEFNVDDAATGALCRVSSPYFDGESLLAYLCALRYYDARPQLTAPEGMAERVESALPMLIRKYCVDALLPGGDTDLAKGFCQWGMMSFALYCRRKPGTSNAEAAAQAAMTLAWWQLYGNEVEHRPGNTGYAVEGLVAAWDIATQAGAKEDAETLRQVILRLLGKLITYQIGGPLEDRNPFIVYCRPYLPERAQGGILSGQDVGFIRIDNVQHQLHAMLLARKMLFE